MKKSARRQFSAWAGIQPDAFVRADFVDDRLGWPEGLAIGRLAHLWMKSQSKDIGVDSATGTLILRWARVPQGEGEAFLAACTDERIHFLEFMPDGRYFIVGNPQALKRIQNQIDKSSSGGKANAKIAKARKLGLLPEAVPQVVPEVVPGAVPQVAPEAVPQAVPEVVLEAVPQVVPGEVPRTFPRVVVVSSKEKTEHTKTTTTGQQHPADPKAQALVDLWNGLRGPLAEVRKIDGERAELAAAALAEEPDLDYWRIVVAKVAASDFCTGKVPTERSPRGWRATFTWLLEGGNHIRVAEGEFDNGAVPLDPERASEDASRAPECDACRDSGFFPGEGPDGTLESFRCDCPAGRASKRDLEVWDEETAKSAGWRRLRKQVSHDPRHP